jgi:hypothetical protein
VLFHALRRLAFRPVDDGSSGLELHGGELVAVEQLIQRRNSLGLECS